MSRTFGNVPYRKKNRSARIDRETKTSIRNKALSAYYSETEMNDGFSIAGTFRNYRGHVVIILTGI